MTKEEIIKNIEKEMKQWNDYYMGCDEFFRIKLRTLFELPEDADHQTISKAILESEGKPIMQDVNNIADEVNNIRFEAQIALRTLTWVYDMLVQESEEEDSK